MSLVGNLEDLGLGDILQIVSLSRKSGLLALHSRGREGQIVFRQGQVVRVSSSVYRDHLGDVLMRRGLIDLDTLRRALVIQKSRKTPVLLGTILAESFNISKDAIEEVVKGQIQQMVSAFFGWTEGSFSFALGDPDDQHSTQFNPLQFMLEHGLNPQWLAMESSRLYDEKIHRGESFEEEESSPVCLNQLFEEPAVSEEGHPGTVGLPLLLVDDDVTTRKVLQERLTQHGFAVRAVGGLRDCRGALRAMTQPGGSLLVLLDLVMPRSDGAGVLGGLDVLRLLRRDYPEAEVLVMSDYPSADAAAELRSLGVHRVLPKPRKAEFANGLADSAVEFLIQSVVDRVVTGEGGAGAENRGTVHLGVELLHEIGESGVHSSTEPVNGTPGLGQLKGMLQELNNPSPGGGIVLLALRFASEFLQRGLVFRVQDDGVLVGLGQFGFAGEGGGGDERIRTLRISPSPGSLLEQALAGQVPVKGLLSDSPADLDLKLRLGGGRPAEVFLAPLISEGRVVALLYGDNGVDTRPLGNTEPLEIFLSQAGLAMEKALLERRLNTRSVS